MVKAAEAELAAWAPSAPPGPVLAAEVATAESIVGAGLAHGRTGVFGPDDLLVDRLLSTNGRVADALQRHILGRLLTADRHGLLVATLQAFVATGSVPEAARLTCVHQNTVLYRLRRVTELTGHDPRIPAEAAILVLALTALRVGDPTTVATGH